MSIPAFDVSAFRDFEATGWDAIADSYHRIFAPIVAPVVDPLLDAAHIVPGSSVLDVPPGSALSPPAPPLVARPPSVWTSPRQWRRWRRRSIQR